MIEKLGITAGKYKTINESEDLYHGFSCVEEIYTKFNGDNETIIHADSEEISIDTSVLKMLLAAPEVLEALIIMVQSEIDFEACGDAGSWNVFETEHVISAVNAIKKATGKSWEEIKELIDE